jgi:hypothetical protein
VNDVLCLDGVEISTNHGHYIALGLPASPYPLGGDAEAVAEDVARLGGFGVAAHPFSPRAELRWSDWSVPVGGLEWLNADSEWRDEGRLRLSRAVLDYLWRPAGALASLLDRPSAALRKWDDLAATRRVVALAGHDAHGGLGEEPGGSRGRRLHIPSYDAAFRTFSVRVTLGRSLTSDAVRDAEALLEAIREGHVFTAVDAIAVPASLEFSARTAGGMTAVGGGELPVTAGAARFVSRASVPSAAATILLRDGLPIAERSGGVLEHEASLPGAYRVEVHVAGAPGRPPVPWIVGNPIYRLSPAAGDPVPEPRLELFGALPLRGEAWRVEASAGSSGRVGTANGKLTLHFELEPAPRSSQFVAVATDLGNGARSADTLQLRASASGPMRVAVQLRFDEGRWIRSIFLDQTERTVTIPFDKLRQAGAAGPLPPLTRAHSLLLVVDLTNAAPGAKGSFTIRDVAFGRRG